MFYFNILSSKVLVHWIEPNAQFIHSVWPDKWFFKNLFYISSPSHTMSEPSIRFNSMNQHFWAQNIKIYHENNNKNATLPNHLVTRSHLPANQHQFLDDIFNFVSSKNWCLLAGKWLRVSKNILQSGNFYYFCAIFLYSEHNRVGSLSWTYRSVRTRCA